jgi:heptosyltransferase III
MKVLLIGNTRIGDFILSSGLIVHLLETYPDLRLTIACGYLCEPLTRHIPRVERVILIYKKPLKKHWFDLWHEVLDTHWDIIIDLRNSFVSRLTQKEKVYRLIRPTGKLHKVEEYARIMKLSPPPSPKIWIDEEHRAFARKIIPDKLRVIGIGPGASHLFKRWPAENFAELCEKLIASDGPYPDAKIAVLGSPIERAPAKPIFDRLPGDKLIDLIGNTDLLKAAAILKRCSLYIGNDNGQMHMSAAMGTRTIGLFGPTPPELYRPWGKDCSFVCSERSQQELAQIEKLIGRDSECLMTGLKVEAVQSAVY